MFMSVVSGSRCTKDLWTHSFNGEMDVIIPSNAIMSLPFAAGGTTSAVCSGGVSTGAAAGVGAGSANAGGFDGIMEDEGDDDIYASQPRCLCDACRDPNTLCIIIAGNLADEIVLMPRSNVPWKLLHLAPGFRLVLAF